MRLYINPILDHDFADPTVIKASDGFYYAYATQYLDPGNIINFQVAKSTNLVEWVLIGDALPDKPKWCGTTQDFWAPNAIEREGKFYLYYSADTYNKRGMGIGVAISDNPAGPFKDSERIIVEGTSIECIDPMPFDDPLTGKKYLYWGSGSYPIRVREMEANGLEFKKGSSTVDLLFPSEKKYESLIEASYVIYKDNYYYLFYSGDNCWQNHTYAVMVARAKNPLGPFEKMGEPILHSNERWFAPGANSIIEDLDTNLWMIYHAVKPNEINDAKSKMLKRVMMMDKITFENGWPRIETNSPSYLPQIAPQTEISVSEVVVMPGVEVLI